MSFQSPSQSQIGISQPAAVGAAFLTHAFTWMFAGLMLTAGVAFVVQGSQGLLDFATNAILLVILGQLGLVVAISALIQRISATVALGLFFVYAASVGLTVGLIVSLYTGASVATAFFSAAAMFGGAAIYGYTTKRSLAGIGGALTMGIIGLVVASVVNIFLGSGTVSWIISLIGVGIFTVLTAYDVQRVSSGALVAAMGSVEKAAVIGALKLYLDFINLFLFLLRLFGSRR